MYEIYKVNKDQYQLHSTSMESAKEGTQLSIMVYAVQILGFSPVELEYAFLDMIRNDKDSAHFGINRTFIYAFNKNEKYKKTA